MKIEAVPLTSYCIMLIASKQALYISIHYNYFVIKKRKAIESARYFLWHFHYSSHRLLMKSIR